MSGNPGQGQHAAAIDGGADDAFEAPAWFDDQWRPKSLQPARPRLLGRRLRIALLAAIVLLHLAGAYWLTRWADRPADEAPRSMQVQFVFELPAETVVALPPPEPEAPPADTPRPTRSTAATPDRRARPEPAPVAPRATRPRPAPAADASAIQLQLYDRDGRVRIGKETMDALDRQFGDARRFDVEIPRLGDAEKVWGRKPVITYEPTRFAAYYRPTRNVLDDVLTRAVEMTTKEVRIPVPGHPDTKMVCRVSLLALGGGCGMLTNGADYVGPLDDPATLSEDEDKECQAWYDKIIGATTQDAWRATRRLYDANCRKPLARKPAG
jgi:hypothetical protein